MTSSAPGLPFRVLLIRNADGAEAWYESEWPNSVDPEAEFASLAFLFRDGNYSCDCNRELFFRRALGEDVGWDEVECGESRYRAIRLVVPGVGETDDLDEVSE